LRSNILSELKASDALTEDLVLDLIRRKEMVLQALLLNVIIVAREVTFQPNATPRRRIIMVDPSQNEKNPHRRRSSIKELSRWDIS